MLIECNYSPDAGEILKQCPDFYNHVFDTFYGANTHESAQFWTKLETNA